uniref:Uncharacterized protein n=1 Tax=Aegilops tauschii subsp. strangulata TaxID=200361 RepID=A0A453TBI8_AEGTS
MDRLLMTPPHTAQVASRTAAPALSASLVIVLVLVATLIVIVIIDLRLGLVGFLLIFLLYLLGRRLLWGSSSSTLALVVGGNGLVVLALELVGLGHVGGLLRFAQALPPLTGRFADLNRKNYIGSS